MRLYFLYSGIAGGAEGMNILLLAVSSIFSLAVFSTLVLSLSNIVFFGSNVSVATLSNLPLCSACIRTSRASLSLRSLDTRNSLSLRSLEICASFSSLSRRSLCWFSSSRCCNNSFWLSCTFSNSRSHCNWHETKGSWKPDCQSCASGQWKKILTKCSFVQ